MDGLLRDLAHDCPWWNEQPRKYEPRCGVRFTDLDHALPPPDHPEEPIYRRRQPSREDVPKPNAPAQRSPAVKQGPKLSEWPHDRLAVMCASCGLSKVVDVAELRASLPNGDMSMAYLRDHLTDGCVTRRVHRLTDQCQVVLRAP
ncbi:hypothetical protein P7D22_22340 [Lichenihabitans sp. Uapishka_5]|uniref:hypothetical protein n=1 Tax=Lichenihabitans sp. Uapishka_5 TaxID=3037302 RepID=UPI0029E7F3DB|nr:hypothetical protein [Lichenihabitans sp. Uapishka_5]MDX7953898.1 hypothetical protein [Lichenihabitans sp. Uapishka_5]